MDLITLIFYPSKCIIPRTYIFKLSYNEKITIVLIILKKYSQLIQVKSKK